ncbi:D-ribose pyranase [Corynebacterium uterequi]|uniref:D-ribose pyranase n=1 Tax=Corynebacterium uterequi TaxID=1072256 RepID=A0A0G3HFQ5_9CORY|nr:D-ribose pyranase [Corynebacterium uterequi]AKK10783.1 ABC-type ribose transport system, auxiliary component [Corynebacterium uterequi]
MLKSGILNAQLAHALARLGHTDTIVIADCGLPVPEGVELVDLALVFGVPTFEQVWHAVTDALEIEAVTIADATPAEVRALLPAELSEVIEVDHEQLKAEVARARVVVRSGSTTAYSNVILRCGVPFGS